MCLGYACGRECILPNSTYFELLADNVVRQFIHCLGEHVLDKYACTTVVRATQRTKLCSCELGTHSSLIATMLIRIHVTHGTA